MPIYSHLYPLFKISILNYNFNVFHGKPAPSKLGTCNLQNISAQNALNYHFSTLQWYLQFKHSSH